MYTLDEYQKQAHATAIYEDGIRRFSSAQLFALAKLSYCIHGLCGESGEAAEKLKKFYRSGGAAEGKNEFQAWNEFQATLIKELGDALWYISEAAMTMAIPLDDLARQNIEKLLDRQRRGVLQGSGDLR